jgi:hypothetical protein
MMFDISNLFSGTGQGLFGSILGDNMLGNIGDKIGNPVAQIGGLFGDKHYTAPIGPTMPGAPGAGVGPTQPTDFNGLESQLQKSAQPAGDNEAFKKMMMLKMMQEKDQAPQQAPMAAPQGGGGRPMQQTQPMPLASALRPTPFGFGAGYSSQVQKRNPYMGY